MIETPSYRLVSYRVVPDSPQLMKDVLYLAASLEAHSGLKTSDIVDIAKNNGVLPLGVDNFNDTPGRGMGGLIQLPNEGRVRPVLMGTRDFMTQCRLQIPDLLDTSTREWQGEKDVRLTYIGWEGSVRAVFKYQTRSSERA